MKTAEEVVRLIEALEQAILKRPGMHAGSREMLEAKLELLESLRASILSDSSMPTGALAYRDYAQQVAQVGPLGFTGKCRHEMWDQFIEFFKGYLASQGRMEVKKKRPKRRKGSGKHEQ
jgi:hypothetical protein